MHICQRNPEVGDLMTRLWLPCSNNPSILCDELLEMDVFDNDHKIRDRVTTVKVAERASRSLSIGYPFKVVKRLPIRREEPGVT